MTMTKSPLQIARAAYQPKLPAGLRGNVAVKEGEPTQSVGNQEEIKALVKERNQAPNAAERERLTEIIKYMERVEMAVVISEEADEEVLFAQKGLNILPHRKKMNEITPEGADIEDRFKNADDPLSLVFVCAMWLTGFDVKSLSTLYLDKPMKDHTLMQAIARANRVYPGKPCGIIVDYVNVFKYMQQALSQYAVGDSEGDYPAKDIDRLIASLDEVIEETDLFLQTVGIDISKTLAEAQLFDKLEEMRKNHPIHGVGRRVAGEDQKSENN